MASTVAADNTMTTTTTTARVAVRRWEDCRVDDLVIKELRSGDKGGSSAFIDQPPTTDGSYASNRFKSPKVRLAFPVRPSIPTNIKQPADLDEENLAALKFNVELAVPPQYAEFAANCKRLDSRVMATALANKSRWLSSKAQDAETERDLKMVYTAMLKPGGKNLKDPSKPYDPTIRAKIEGWGPYAREFEWEKRMMKGELKDGIKEVKWRDRVVMEDGSTTPTDRETQFYLFRGDKDAEGNDRFTDVVPVLGLNGKPVKNPRNPKRWLQRFVGPCDCKVRSELKVVFTVSRIYVAESFGPIVTLKEVYIYPPPPKTRAQVDGVAVVERSAANTEAALRALQAVTAAATAENDYDGDDVGEEEDDGESATAAGVSLPPAAAATDFAAALAAATAATTTAEEIEEDARSPQQPPAAAATSGERVGGKKRRERDGEGGGGSKRSRREHHDGDEPADA